MSRNIKTGFAILACGVPLAFAAGKAAPAEHPAAPPWTCHIEAHDGYEYANCRPRKDAVQRFERAARACSTDAAAEAYGTSEAMWLQCLDDYDARHR